MASPSRTGKYAHIEGLAEIKPPYPAVFSADWWELRQRMEEIMAKGQRKRNIRWTEAELSRSKVAKQTSLGDEDAKIEYERDGMTREEWLEKWWPSGRGSLKDRASDAVRDF